MNRVTILREKITRLTGLLTEKKVKVTQRGSQAYVRYNSVTELPELVNIPYIPENASEKFVVSVEGFLDHEVAHVLFSKGRIVAEANKKGVGGFHNATEDIFIEKAMGEKFPGSKINLEVMHDLFISDYIDKGYQENKTEPVRYLLVALLRSYAGQTAFVEYIKDKLAIPEIAAVNKALGEYCREALPKMSSSEDALNVALKIKELLEPPPKPEPKANGGKGETPEEEGEEGKSTKPNDDDSETDDVEQPSNTTEPEDGEAEEPKPEETEPEDGDENESDKEVQQGGDDESDSESHKEEDASSDGKEDKVEGSANNEEDQSEPDEDLDGGVSAENEGDDIEDSPSDGEESGSKFGDGGEELPELPDNLGELQNEMRDFDETMSEILSREASDAIDDAEYSIYTRDFDIVAEFDYEKMGGLASNAVSVMQDKVDHMVGKIQRDLERAISSQNKMHWETNKISGVLNNSSLTRVIKFGEQRAFKRKIQTKSVNTAVTLLIDCSGSMGGYEGKIAIAAYTAYALASTLERLKINYEILGFTTLGDVADEVKDEYLKNPHKYSRFEPIYIPIFKSFGERLNSEVKASLASLAGAEWLGNNVDGESLEYAASRLAKQKEQRKILMVLSDGDPACRGNIHQLRPHLTRTIANITKSNIEVLGIGILSNAVENYYPKSVVIKKLNDLPLTVMGQIRKLLMN